MHFLDGKLREFENGQYDAALREQLDRVQQEAVGAVADMRAAQEELKSKLTVLSDAVAAANQQGTELDQALIAVKAGTSALDTKLNEVNSRIVNYSNMAGNTLAGVLRASIGLP